MNLYLKLKTALITLCLLSANIANAKDATIGPVKLDSVSIINVAGFGHVAGNLEIKITDGISNLNGSNCDTDYLTTLNTGAGFKDMLSILLAAQVSNKNVLLGITDNPAHNAFPGRCSLIYAIIQK
jgi:hypothetical protein